jgi:YlmC/YmxH family sporulation protein
MERIADLQCKEVVNIADGARLGYVSDAEIDVLTGKVTAIVVPGKCRFFGLFGRGEEYVIPWQCIRRFGEDIILVEVIPDRVCRPRPKRPWF